MWILRSDEFEQRLKLHYLENKNLVVLFKLSKSNEKWILCMIRSETWPLGCESEYMLLDVVSLYGKIYIWFLEEIRDSWRIYGANSDITRF